MIKNGLEFQYVRLYEVKFLGWADSFIEKIGAEKIAPLCTYTIDPNHIYSDMSRDCSGTPHWVLCKQSYE